MTKFSKTPISFVAVLALSAACSNGGVTGGGVLPASAKSIAPVAKAPDVVREFQTAKPQQPVITSASITFASSREFQEFPVQPTTNSIFHDVGSQNSWTKPDMIPTQYREVIKRTVSSRQPWKAEVYATTLGIKAEE